MLGKAAVFVAGLCLCATPSSALDSIKVAVGSGGNLESFVAEIGARGGLFEKHGLKPEVFYTAGGGETLQAVLSQSAPIGVSLGSSGALGAFSKGAPLKIIGASAIGSPVYWYARADSPIRALPAESSATARWAMRAGAACR